MIRIALEENKDLKQAVATVDEFAARALIAKTDFASQKNATVNAPVFGNTKDVAFPGFPNPFNYSVQGSLAWKIDIWGRIRRSNEAALGDLLAREENRRALMVQIVGGGWAPNHAYGDVPISPSREQSSRCRRCR